MPTRVPPGSVAIVGAVPVTTTSFRHWLPIILHRPAVAGLGQRRHRFAAEQTVAFLVKAQWLQQEASAEGVNESALGRLVEQRTVGAQAPSGTSRADVALQARLDIIAEALRERHRSATAATQAEAAAYYARHRSQFRSPAVRDTLMVVTHARSDALAAKAALARGERWANVARRFSEDSSALAGGAYAVVEGVQPASLWHAASAARRNELVGPIEAPQVGGPPALTYYLFEVVAVHRPVQQPLGAVAGQLRTTLTEQTAERAFAAFTSAYERRWRSRTLCAPRYLVPACRNARGGLARRPSGRVAHGRDPETGTSSVDPRRNTFG